MAISEMLPGLEVVVVQNGTEMIEHTDNDVEDNERTTTRYIEAKSDQEFAIRIGVTARTDFTGDTLACHVYVDGKWAQAPILEKSRFRWDNYVRYVRGVEVQNSLEKRFHFAGLETGALATDCYLPLQLLTLHSRSQEYFKRRGGQSQRAWKYRSEDLSDLDG